jgi:hypothetical protein
MTEQELRAMIRDAIARHTGPGAVRLQPDSTGFGETAFAETGMRDTGVHASHARLPLLRSGDDDGQCLIEPAVRCNHCGYCLSLGH